MADLVRRSGAAIARRLQSTDRGPLSEYLAFTLANDTYAVPIGIVREILKPPPLAEVPRAPREVLGVASVRGMLITVIDLRLRLRMSAAEPTRKSRILLVEGAEEELIGLLVDEVRQVYRLAEREIEPAADILGGQLADHVLGVGRPDGELVLLIDLRAVIDQLGSI